MPPVSKIALLPPAVRQELNERLVSSAFGDMLGHAEWLKSQGYDVSKTGVGEYALRQRDAIEASCIPRAIAAERDRLSAVEVRLRVLEAASRTAPAGHLLGMAEELLAWVYDGSATLP